MKALPHHEDIVGRSPYNVNAWVMYLEEVDAMIADAVADASKGKKKNTTTMMMSDVSISELVQLRDMIGKRSLQLLPRSYKLWKLQWEFVTLFHPYLEDVTTTTTTTTTTTGSGGGGPKIVLSCFERAVVTLHKFPRVWIHYLDYAHKVLLSTKKQGSTTINDTTTTTTTTTTIHNNNNEEDASYHHYYLIHPTQLRHLVNRALEALPVAQHQKIWPTILRYYQTSPTSSDGPVASLIPKETKLSILRRYIQFQPAATKEIADFISDELGHWGEAALMYVDLMNTSSSTTTDTMSSRKDLWMALAKICTRYPVETEIGLDFDAMVRAILANISDTTVTTTTTIEDNNNNNFSSSNTATTTPGAIRYLPQEMQGVLWSQLADAWIRRGEFQLARSVYEEAIEKVSKVRDFTILLDAYLQFEEGLLEATMERQVEEETEKEERGDNNNDDDTNTEPNSEVQTTNDEDDDDDDWDILLRKDGDKGPTSMTDLELALARAEDLTARRPILLNRVLLRQNPDDVGEWLKRARLYKENEQIHQAAGALEEGLRTVKARRAIGGNPNQMVLQLAKIYDEDCKDVAKARNLFDRICNQWMYEFKNVDDLAECFAAWVELELREEAWDDALDIIRSSVVVPPNAPKWTRGLAKSIRLWDLLLDLEESLGTVQSTKDAYNRAMEQKIATPLHILNYANFLAEQKYFEESFSAYERGIELFSFPGVKLIWKAYLDSFLKRYGGTKVERTRDLFQRCLEACPPEDSTEFFLMNGKFEEEHGLVKRALGVYQQMCQKVPAEEKYTAYQLFIAKTAKFLGQTATRDIYQNAIQDLEDSPASKLCLDFAEMETSLQEIDRARAVLTYGAQMADPRRNDEYWNTWKEFEIAHGNEETFREMLRVKRSVEASFSTVNYNAAEMSGTAAKTEMLSNEDAMKMIAEREGMEYEQRNAASSTLSGFVSGKRTAQSANLEDVEERVAKLRRATAVVNQNNDVDADDDGDADEIDIDDELDDDEEEKDHGGKESDIPEESKPTVSNVSTKTVPAAVFGGLKDDSQ
ncbi:tetratricopeptide repeat protein [Nitzschia inconspicua]|uniref:Tetratricopeptide repeat protein n=1 Tax=Nitzschia inconspicua TaxID=303405 RepID=A0A9K3KWC6_9STRA|nr:tetratricopeptide repeat protein [Nitzschia inconspicua]